MYVASVPETPRTNAHELTRKQPVHMPGTHLECGAGGGGGYALVRRDVDASADFKEDTNKCGPESGGRLSKRHSKGAGEKTENSECERRGQMAGRSLEWPSGTRQEPSVGVRRPASFPHIMTRSEEHAARIASSGIEKARAVLVITNHVINSNEQ